MASKKFLKAHKKMRRGLRAAVQARRGKKGLAKGLAGTVKTASKSPKKSTAGGIQRRRKAASTATSSRKKPVAGALATHRPTQKKGKGSRRKKGIYRSRLGR